MTTVKLKIPKSYIKPVIDEGLALAARTHRNQYVRAIAFDGLFADIGLTDDADMKVGTLYATCLPTGDIIYEEHCRAALAKATKKGEE